MFNKVIFIGIISLLHFSALASPVELNENTDVKNVSTNSTLVSSADCSPCTETIVVTGTRTAKFLSDSPVSVNVISGETLAKVTTGTLAQALNFIPGVVVTRSVKDGYNIQMQGFDSDHVLVLVDGKPIISPAGSSADLDQIAALNIKQIEVVRGAASVMYGSAAMGGVLNIITDKSKEDSASLQYNISQYTKENRTESSDVNHSVKLGFTRSFYDWSTSLNTLYIEDKGFDFNPETVKQNSPLFKKSFITLATKNHSYAVSPSIKYQFLSEEKQRDTGTIPGQSNAIYYRTEVEKHEVDLGLNANNGLEPWQVDARYITHKETSGQSNSIRDIDIKLAMLSGQFVLNYDNAEVVSGGEIKFDELNQKKPVDNVVEVDNESRDALELFSQLNWNQSNYNVLAGVRVQRDSDFGWKNAFRLSGSVKYNMFDGDLHWRFGAGESYKVPTLKQRFYVFDHSQLGYMVLGNKDLVPETANTIDTSVVFNKALSVINADFNIEVSGHYSQTDNFIETVVDVERSAETGLSISVYNNLKEAKIHGVNFTAGLTFNQAKVQFNYSYLASEDEYNQRLTSRPRHQIKANFSYDIDAYDIELLTYFVYQADEAVSDDYVGIANNEYTTVNFAFNQQISRGFHWSMNINNVFDEHVDDSANSSRLFDSRPTSTREFSAGISYKF